MAIYKQNCRQQLKLTWGLWERGQWGGRSLGYKQEADKGVGGVWVQRWSQIDQQSISLEDKQSRASGRRLPERERGREANEGRYQPRAWGG